MLGQHLPTEVWSKVAAQLQQDEKKELRLVSRAINAAVGYSCSILEEPHDIFVSYRGVPDPARFQGLQSAHFNTVHNSRVAASLALACPRLRHLSLQSWDLT